MQSAIAMPSFFLYIEAALLIWIIVQIIMGRAIYRRSRISRREDPRGFWALIGMEALIVIPIFCFQFHWNRIALLLSLILVLFAVCCALYIAWLLVSILIHPKQCIQRIAENPKGFLQALFFGR